MDGWLFLQALCLVAAIVVGLLCVFGVKAKVSLAFLFAVLVVVGVWALPIWKAAWKAIES